MKKLVNILFFIIILIFFLGTYRYYSSNKNIDIKKFNRTNINQILNTKISSLPILNDDTNNVIKFNDGYSNKINNDKPRSFWDLLNSQ
jgi:hypothetical protein